MLVISRDAKELTKFYGEVQKRLTDYLKRLLGLKHLDLWEGSASVIRILDLEAAKERVAYFFANPARAHLVDSIEEYPGLSTYQSFSSSPKNIFSKVSEKVPWIRCPTLPKIDKAFGDQQDVRLTTEVETQALIHHRLITYPNLWMYCFGVIKEEIEEVNKDILWKLRGHEDEARATRDTKRMLVLGAKRLVRQALMLVHTPKKYGRKIFVIARDKIARRDYIELVKSLSDLCSECYQRWKRCDFSFVWPAGTFPPARPMMANALA
jgi:hypothetical protein